MKLEELLKEIGAKQVCGPTDLDIREVHFDSRKIGQGDLFVALRGVNVDGHLYIEKAMEAGAVAVVCEQLPEQLHAGLCYVSVADSAFALGNILSAFFGYPSRKLKLVGVTGTNGKTTTATLLYELVRFMGKKAGLLSTVCNYVDGKQYPSTHTTPDPLELNQYLRLMVEAGCEYCFMEVSSHAIHQKRIAGLDFDGAIFSNITHDHLDYHKTFKAYIEASKKLFSTTSKKMPLL